jgi:LemA protein
MDLPLTALALVGFVVATYVAYAYNHLVMLRHNVDKAWANIGVLLKQRHDELPRLVAVCREHMRYEQDVLERLTRARTAAVAARESRDVAGVGGAEAALRSSLAALFALAESYPTLKAEARYTELAARIAALETSIADRRSFYNESVRIHNVAIEQFPQSLLALTSGFAPRRLLSFDAAALHAPAPGFRRG